MISDKAIQALIDSGDLTANEAATVVEAVDAEKQYPPDLMTKLKTRKGIVVEVLGWDPRGRSELNRNVKLYRFSKP